MPALEPVRGLRVVADPAALDTARWSGPEPLVLRTAPDEALALGADGVTVDDPHAIVAEERGYSAGWGTVDDVAGHLEWPLPAARPALAQGALAGVPARLWLPGDDRVLVVVATAYAAELAGRLR